MAEKIGASCSKGHLALKHNRRESHTENVEITLSEDNVMLIDETKGTTIEEYVNDLMKDVVDEYNAKQKRSDRQIESYTKWHENNSNIGKMCYEQVIQIGEHEDLGKKYYSLPKGSPEREAIRKEYINAYTDVLNQIKEKFPHQKIVQAAIHFDEPKGTPHLHFDTIPIGEGYKQGLTQQLSMGRALTLDGIGRAKDRSKESFQMKRMWETIRHDILNEKVREMGYEPKEEKHGLKHMDKSKKKKKMAEVNEQKAEAEEMMEFATSRETSINAREVNVAKREAKEKEIAEAKAKQAVEKVVANKYDDLTIAVKAVSRGQWDNKAQEAVKRLTEGVKDKNMIETVLEAEKLLKEPMNLGFER